jgi:hypothetical protein
LKLTPSVVNDLPSRTALAAINGATLLRTEVWTPQGWKRILDTTSIQRQTVRSSSFAHPTGYQSMALRSTDPDMKLAMMGSIGYQTSASVIRGPGPVMSNPELYVVFWGSSINKPEAVGFQQGALNAINTATRTGYTNYLAQYGIQSMSTKGVYKRTDVPPSAVGYANFAAISEVVYNVGFYDGAPIFWWCCGINDPLYVILVTTDEVDPGHWGGYHLAAPSLTHAVLPFPMTLFTHDAMPYAIAKVDPEALKIPIEGTAQRAPCARDPSLSSTPPCTQVVSLDEATASVTHEIVEAVTDTYPFFGFSDPSKQPAANYSEIADICEFNPTPWATSTVVLDSALATFWSNLDKACVPESRPLLRISEPVSGTTVSSFSPVFLRGYASDPWDGEITGQIAWSVDTVSKGTSPAAGTAVSAGVLAPGPHTVTATVENSRHLRTTVSITFVVAADAPKVAIDSPSGSLKYGTDELVPFRGSGFDVYPGDIAENALVWTDGRSEIGRGSSFTHRLQSVGAHAVQLSVLGSSGVTASAGVTVSVVAPTGKPSVQLTAPANRAVIPVDFGKGKSAPVTLQATATDANGTAVPATFTWKSSIDGNLGTGATISAPLTGGGCVRDTHTLTVTATPSSGPPADDSITLYVGQPC